VIVEIADLGRWGAAHLLAEYDPEDDAIRVDARAVAAVAAALGPAEARRFVACAVAHESYHRAHPRATEADARRFARETTGGDADAYARLLRQ
jgi:hypothetical protein